MLREFRVRDTEAFLPLLARHFPEENALSGWDPSTYARLIRRFYRWDARLVLGLLSLFRRPVFRFFVVEADGRLVATTLLTFTERAGYVSTVVVDPLYRRRGFARRLLEAARATARRLGRRYLVLDVLDQNAPARTLYRSLGYAPLRHVAYMVRERPAGIPAAAPDGLRTFRPSDAPELARTAMAQLPPAVAEVLPAQPEQFGLSRFVTSALAAESEAWVAPAEGDPAAFVRATVSRGTVAGNLTAPLLGDRVDPALGSQLVRCAVDWIDRRGAPRILCEVPDHNRRGRLALEAEGFHEALGLETFVLPL